MVSQAALISPLISYSISIYFNMIFFTYLKEVFRVPSNILINPLRHTFTLQKALAVFSVMVYSIWCLSRIKTMNCCISRGRMHGSSDVFAAPAGEPYMSTLWLCDLLAFCVYKLWTVARLDVLRHIFSSFGATQSRLNVFSGLQPCCIRTLR